MSRRKDRSRIFEDKMDMTPLIDCVFLLIMFFILTTEITMQQENVLLPFALEGKTKEEQGGEEEIVKVVSVVVPRTQAGAVAEGRAEIRYNKRSVDERQLIDELQKEVRYDAEPPPLGRGRTPEVVGGRKLSQLKIMIRADKSAKAEYLRTIFSACEKVEPAIYKIEISTEQPTVQ